MEGAGNTDSYNFLAVAPSRGQIMAPTDAPSQFDLSPPTNSLTLEFINGYSCEDAR